MSADLERCDVDRERGHAVAVASDWHLRPLQHKAAALLRVQRHSTPSGKGGEENINEYLSKI